MSEEMNTRILPEGVTGATEELGLRSLRRTQALLGARALHLATAISLTTLVLAFLPASDEGLMALIRGSGITGALVTFAVAAVFWGLFLKKCHELKATGLPTRRGARARNAWGTAGFLVAVVARELVQTLAGSRLAGDVALILVGFGSIWAGERLHQIERADEIRFRSTTRKIFEDQDNG